MVVKPVHPGEFRGHCVNPLFAFDEKRLFVSPRLENLSERHLGFAEINNLFPARPLAR